MQRELLEQKNFLLGIDTISRSLAAQVLRCVLGPLSRPAEEHA